MTDFDPIVTKCAITQFMRTQNACHESTHRIAMMWEALGVDEAPLSRLLETYNPLCYQGLIDRTWLIITMSKLDQSRCILKRVNNAMFVKLLNELVQKYPDDSDKINQFVLADFVLDFCDFKTKTNRSSIQQECYLAWKFRTSIWVYMIGATPEQHIPFAQSLLNAEIKNLYND